MNRQNWEELPPPPGVMGSLRDGFYTVSSHVWLILLPLLLDLFLWLGPRLSVGELLKPFFLMAFNQVRTTLTSSSDVQRFTAYQSTFSDVLEHFNLLSLVSKLQAFPVGVSSLLAQTMPVESPLGSQNVIQITSLPGSLVLGFLFTVIGWMIGGLYFRSVSGIVLGDANRARMISLSWAIFQTLLLSFIWVFGLMAIVVPMLVILTILTRLSPVLASGAILIGL
ncbi:MAG TPA: hypothetical protein VFY83_00475, partial [Anaerolineales bacterium]|nr:hypothetical protein [Anaerolineales bacterium]